MEIVQYNLNLTFEVSQNKIHLNVRLVTISYIKINEVNLRKVTFEFTH